MIRQTKSSSIHLLVALTALGMAGLSCQQLPGGKKEQATVGGGLAGAAAGAVIADDSTTGALIGGLLGAGGGYLLGTQLDNSKDEATEAARKAREEPVTVEQARSAQTADVNDDGFVSIDEVLALEQAGLSDDVITARLRATNQRFALTQAQEQRLIKAGVSPSVIAAMKSMQA